MQIRKENPFLGLKPYGEKDQLYGRDKDLFLMTDRIFCARTTLLFAGSGVGKTSFINAKIIPELNSQYASIIYHKEWAIGQPLENLLNSIAKHLPAADASPAVAVAAAVAAGAQDTSPVKPPLFDASNKLACYLKQFISEEPGSEDDNRCLLILDQFEEVFQYHRGKAYFDLFITQLTQLINYKHCNVRVLFSMREEFLGELSIFDNKIPDLFSNYYRLKNPNKHDAKNIISRTCSLVDMPVDEKNLKRLVADLTTIETISATPTHDQNGDEGPQDLDIVAPPYLQIACRRLWERQFNSANSAKPATATGEPPEEKFLSDYKDGAAREMLKSFCEEILNACDKGDRALVAEAFNYLVTKKGAKMAYALASLADHMGVKEKRLESVLHRLSADNSRILRESKGPDRALWYELYHDMYGKIIDEWRRAYRLQQKRESNAKLIMAAGVIIVIGLVTVLTWQWLDRRQLRRTTLRNGDLSKQLSYLTAKQAYDDLKGTWHSGNKARELWGDAWRRRALFAERTEDAPQAFLSFLKAAEAYPTDRIDPHLLAEIRSYLSSDEYQPLLASYRLEIGVTTSPAFKPILTADGKMLVSIASDRQAFFWDTDSYQLKQRSPQLAVDNSNQSYGSGPPPAFQHVQNQSVESGTQIQAATERLIGGIDNNKFCVWDAKTGQKLWESDPKTGPTSQASKPLITGNVSSYSEVYSQSVQRPSLSFSSDGRYFATSNGLDSPLLYTFSDNKPELLLADVMRNVMKIKFSPDGQSVALVFKDGTAQLRKLDTNESRPLAIDGKSIRRIIFNSDGSRLLADMGDSKPAEIWNTAEGVRIKPIYVSMGDQFFCPDNKTIGSILPINESNRTIIGIRFWDSETDAVSIRAIKLDERIDYFINPNGKLLTIGVSGNARLWALSPPSAQKLITDSAKISVREISNDGQVVVTVNNNQSLTVWDAEQLKKIKDFPLPIRFAASRDEAFPGQRDPIDQLVVSPKGKYVCLTNFFNFSLRKLEDNKEITSGRFENNPYVRAAAFSPNEEIFAVANQRNSITLWMQLDTTPTSTPLTVREDVYDLVFSPDGRYLAAILGDRFNSRYVRIFDITDASEELSPTEGFTPNIALGRNGIIIGTIPNDDTAVLVWNIATGRSQKLWHDTSVTAVALNQDASYAVTSTSNGTLQLWDTASGKPVASGTCSTRIRKLMMSEDGATVVALSDKWVHIHSINKEAMKTAGEGALRYVDGREIAAPESLRILDSSGKKLRNVLPPVQDSLKVELLDFSSKPTGDDPVGSASNFFSIWTGKLALNFNENGRVTPIHPQ